jgi:hypothetical protein
MSPTRSLVAFGAVVTTLGVVTGLVAFSIAFLVGSVLVPGVVPDVSAYFGVATTLFLVGVVALVVGFVADRAVTLRLARRTADRIRSRAADRREEESKAV